MIDLSGLKDDLDTLALMIVEKDHTWTSVEAQAYDRLYHFIKWAKSGRG